MVLHRSLALLLVGLVFPNGAMWAQNQIAGFAGFRWGTTRAAILARFGKPTEDLSDSTVERLNYVQGPDSGYLFVLSHKPGLIAGIRILPRGVGDQCSATVRADKARITHALGSLTPVETRTPVVSASSCGGFEEWDVLWRDGEGNRILLSVDSVKHRLYISYSSHLVPN